MVIMKIKKPHPLSLRQIITIAITLYFRNIKRYLLLSFFTAFPMVMLDLAILYIWSSKQSIADNSPGFLLAVFVMDTLIMILLRFTYVVIAHEAYNYLLKNVVGLDKIIDGGFKKIALLISTGSFIFAINFLLNDILAPLGSIVTLIVTYLLSIFIVLYPFIIAFEQFNPLGVLRKSITLLRGNFIKLLLLTIFTDLISPMSLWRLDAFSWLQIKPDITMLIGFGLIETAIMPLQALVLLLFYFELRREKEKFDIRFKRGA